MPGVKQSIRHSPKAGIKPVVQVALEQASGSAGHELGISPANKEIYRRVVQVPMEQVLIVYDDLDLDVGAVRLRAKGGAGGHNGMRSIQQRLGGNSSIPRLKIGIGRPTMAQPIASYVLEVINTLGEAVAVLALCLTSCLVHYILVFAR